jgi:dihydroflavonol-4-reductase
MSEVRVDLVTGGTGIVGCHVIDALLERGRGVRALVREGADRSIIRRVLEHYHSDGAARFQRIEWAVGDLFDILSLEAAMRDAQHVYHCAALVSFDGRDGRELLRVNINGTANVVDTALAAGVERLCHVSSTATITVGPEGGAADESRPFAENGRQSAYAVSKYGAELEVYRGIAEGLDAVMVNPCVVLGPGLGGRSSMTMVERFRQGSRFFPGGSNAVVDARDVATAMVELVRTGHSGERYLLVGENVTYERLATLLTASAGRPRPSFRLKPWMLEAAWRLEALRTLFGGRAMITKQTARTASRQRLYDGSKARATGLVFRTAEEAVANVAAFLDGN